MGEISLCEIWELRLGNVARGLQDLPLSLGLSRDCPVPDKPQTQGSAVTRGSVGQPALLCPLSHRGWPGEGTISCLCSLGEMRFTCFINQTDFPRNSLSVMTNYMLQHINGRMVVSPAVLGIMK